MCELINIADRKKWKWRTSR